MNLINSSRKIYELKLTVKKVMKAVFLCLKLFHGLENLAIALETIFLKKIKSKGKHLFLMVDRT